MLNFFANLLDTPKIICKEDDVLCKATEMYCNFFSDIEDDFCEYYSDYSFDLTQSLVGAKSSVNQPYVSKNLVDIAQRVAETNRENVGYFLLATTALAGTVSIMYSMFAARNMYSTAEKLSETSQEIITPVVPAVKKYGA